MITLPTAAGATTEYEDFYETTLLNPVTAADTDIYPTVLPSSAVGFLVIDPYGANPEVIFYNFKGANFVRVPSVTDGEGRGVGNTTPRGYDAGTKIGMYSIAEFYEGIVTGNFMRDGFLQSRHFGSGIDPNSWIGTGEVWNYVGNNGAKEYQYVTAGDKRTKYQNGMKVRMPRTLTVAPTQSAKFIKASSQYATRVTGSVANMTFTGNFTCQAHINPATFFGASGNIVSRTNNSTAGFQFYLNAFGQLGISYGGGAGMRYIETYVSVPIMKDSFVSASVNVAAGTAELSVDGVIYPSRTSSGSATTLTQVGDLQIAAGASVGFFDGAVSEVRIFSALQTIAQVKDSMHRTFVGNEANLIGYWPLNGNFNDSTANGNHLTAVAGAIATNAYNVLQATEYGIIHGLSFSAGNTTITVFTGTDYNAPPENLSGISYSAAASPIGFPRAKAKWRVQMRFRQQVQTALANTTGNLVGAQFTVPMGEWRLKNSGFIQTTSAGVGYTSAIVQLSATQNVLDNPHEEMRVSTPNVSAATSQTDGQMFATGDGNYAAQTTLYAVAKTAGNYSVYYGSGIAFLMEAESAYI